MRECLCRGIGARGRRPCPRVGARSVPATTPRLAQSCVRTAGVRGRPFTASWPGGVHAARARKWRRVGACCQLSRAAGGMAARGRMRALPLAESFSKASLHSRMNQTFHSDLPNHSPSDEPDHSLEWPP
jgi:hypothetical protein